MNAKNRDKLTHTLLRTFTPETAEQNFGSPQDDLEGWQRAVSHQGRLRDDFEAGVAMPEDPRIKALRRK